MRSFFGFLLAASLAHASVDGTVLNASHRQPQPGATVTLYQTTQQGPQNLGSVKSDATGKFAFPQDVKPGQGGGPLLLQAVYSGVQYNLTIPPGQTQNGVVIPVYESSKNQGKAVVQQHMVLLEPASDGNLLVSETYIYNNDSDSTWYDPDLGTMHFELPAGADASKVEVNVLAPGGLPIRRAPDPAGKPNQFKLDFPIKPGESRVDLAWSMPFKSPGDFVEHVLAKGGLTRIVLPPGVEVKADGLKSLGSEPTTKAQIFEVTAPGGDIKVNLNGTGSLRGPQQDDQGGGGSQSLSENLPKLYGMAVGNSNLIQSLAAVKWILLSILGMLAFGFILLYRKGDPTSPPASSASVSKASKHARGLG
jgi:hypothetical protein